MMLEKDHRYSGLLTTSVLLMAAGAWPAAGLQWLTGPNINLSSIAAAVLVILMARGWWRAGRPRVPFELLWPAVLLTLLGIVWDVSESFQLATLTCGGGLLFLSAVHITANRAQLAAALSLGGLAGAVIGLLSLGASFGFIFPTGWSIDGDIRFFGPDRFEDLLVLLAIATLMSMSVVLGGSRIGHLGWLSRWPGRFAQLLAACCSVSALLYFIRFTEATSGFAPQLHRLFIFPALPMTLAGLYLTARVVAKLLIARHLDPPGAHGLLALFIMLSLGCCIYLGSIPAMGVFVLLGMVGAYGLPRTSRVEAGAPVFPSVLVLLALGVVRLAFVLPGDPRDYAAAHDRLTNAGDTASAARLLGYVRRTNPLESRLAWLYAEKTMAAGDFESCADWAVSALQQTHGGNLLPPPSREEVQRFGRSLRGVLPNDSATDSGQGVPLALERLLMAAGQEDRALSELGVRGENAPSLETDSAPLAQALAEMLGKPESFQKLSGWPPGELAQCLAKIGPNSRLVKAPDGFPRKSLPVVLVARETVDWLSINVYSGDGAIGGCLRRDGAASLAPSLWSTPEKDPEVDAWFVSYGASVELWFGSVPRLVFLNSPLGMDVASPGDWQVLCVIP